MALNLYPESVIRRPSGPNLSLQEIEGMRPLESLSYLFRNRVNPQSELANQLTQRFASEPPAIAGDISTVGRMTVPQGVAAAQKFAELVGKDLPASESLFSHIATDKGGYEKLFKLFLENFMKNVTPGGGGKGGANVGVENSNFIYQPESGASQSGSNLGLTTSPRVSSNVPQIPKGNLFTTPKVANPLADFFKQLTGQKEGESEASRLDSELEQFALSRGLDINQLRSGAIPVPGEFYGVVPGSSNNTVATRLNNAKSSTTPLNLTAPQGYEGLLTTLPRTSGTEVTTAGINLPGRLFDDETTKDLYISQDFGAKEKLFNGINWGLDIAPKSGKQFNVYNPSGGDATLVYWDPTGGHAIYKLSDGSYISNMHSAAVPGTQGLGKTYDENGINGIRVAPGGILARAGNTADQKKYFSSGTHASLEFILPGTSIPQYIFSGQGRVNPTSFIQNQIKGVTGYTSPVQQRIGPISNYGGAKQMGYGGIFDFLSPITSGVTTVLDPLRNASTAGILGLGKNALGLGAKGLGLAGTLEAVSQFADLFKNTPILRAFSPQALYEDYKGQPIVGDIANVTNKLSKPLSSLWDLITQPSTGTVPPTIAPPNNGTNNNGQTQTDTTPTIQSLLGPDLAARYYGNTNPTTGATNYNISTGSGLGLSNSPVDRTIKGLGLTDEVFKGLTPNEQALLRLATQNYSNQTKSNVLNAAFKTSTELQQGQRRAKEYAGRSSGDISLTPGGRQLISNFQDYSNSILSGINTEQTNNQNALSSNLLSSLSSVLATKEQNLQSLAQARSQADEGVKRSIDLAMAQAIINKQFGTNVSTDTAFVTDLTTAASLVDQIKKLKKDEEKDKRNILLIQYKKLRVKYPDLPEIQ